MSFHKISNGMAQLGLIFLILLGIAIPISVAATNILAGLVLLCFCLSGQYKERIYSMTQTLYSRAALILFAWLLVVGLIGALFGEVPWTDMFARLAGYKKLILIGVMVGLLAVRKDEKIQIFCLQAALLGGVVNLVAAFATHALGSDWIVSRVGLPGTAIFSNSAATGFAMCCLFWGSSVAWLYGEKFKTLWFSLALFTAIFLLNLNVSRTSMVVFFALSAVLFVMAVNLYRKKQQKTLYRDWVKVAVLLMVAIFAGQFLTAPRFYNLNGVSTEAAPQPLNSVKQEIDRSMLSINKAAQGEYGTSIGIRLRFYQNSLLLIADHPILGCGVGCVQTAYTAAYGKEPGIMLTDNLHNEYINMLVQAGILGLFIFFLWFAALYQSALISLSCASAFRLGLGIIFLIFCVFNSSLMDFHEGWLFCYLTTLCIVPMQKKGK